MNPSLSEFDPRVIPMQMNVIKDIRKNYDYSIGKHEVLLSGARGSSKSIVMAHIIITHCLLYPGARVLIGRKTMPDLKETLLATVLEHIGDDLVEGVDYRHYKAGRHKIIFRNGSEIVCRSWKDKNFKQFRSLQLSLAAIEELTESGDDYKEFYKELSQAVGRLPHIPEKIIIAATNPDSPSHWVYQHFIENNSPQKHVYYSVTLDNPFLPPTYRKELLDILDPQMARRMVNGEWCEITKESIYYNYSSQRNYKKDTKYIIKDAHPIAITFDFNIGEGKPMSAAVGQYIDGIFHVAKEYIVHGARTLDLMEEIEADNMFSYKSKFLIFGDATGGSRTTNSIKSNYDLIKEFLSNYRREDKSSLQFEMKVPRSNPPIRERHNKVNAAFLNANGAISFYCYSDTPTVDKAFRLTKLKQGGRYIEDDSDEFQHISTAIGYWIHFMMVHYREKRLPYSLM